MVLQVTYVELQPWKTKLKSKWKKKGNILKAVCSFRIWNYPSHLFLLSLPFLQKIKQNKERNWSTTCYSYIYPLACINRCIHLKCISLILIIKLIISTSPTSFPLISYFFGFIDTNAHPCKSPNLIKFQTHSVVPTWRYKLCLHFLFS